MRRIISFIAISFTGLPHSLSVGPDDLFDQQNVGPDLFIESANTDFDVSYLVAQPDDLFSSIEPDKIGVYDPSDSIFPLAEASSSSSSGSPCVGELMEPINIARSLDLDQSLDIAGNGFCLEDSQKETPINLKLPDPTDLYNLVKPGPEWPSGYWYCAAGDKVILVCCAGSQSWDSSRQDCTTCRFQNLYFHWYFQVFEHALTPLMNDLMTNRRFC